MIIYITKYILTKGIVEIEGEFEYPSYVPEGWIKYGMNHCYQGNDAFVLKEDAIKKAESILEKKIMSLEKQIKKLKQTKFVS